MESRSSAAARMRASPAGDPIGAQTLPMRRRAQARRLRLDARRESMQVEQGGLAYTVVHPDELRRRFAHGESFAVVDARSEESYRRSGETIVTAIRIPPDQLVQRRSEIPRGRTLLLLADEDAAESMALGFLQDGYSDVYLIEGGFEAYKAAGGKTEPARL
jgi:rhodanese-related sulfurtransferase